jgi:hypothetical protein
MVSEPGELGRSMQAQNKSGVAHSSAPQAAVPGKRAGKQLRRARGARHGASSSLASAWADEHSRRGSEQPWSHHTTAPVFSFTRVLEILLSLIRFE